MSESTASGPGGWRSLFAGYAGRMLFGLSLAWFALIAGRLLLPPLLPAIIDEFGIRLSTAGALLTALQATTALVLYPAGRLSDELSRATLLVPGLAVSVLGLGLMAGAPAFPALLAGAVVFGLGSGLFTVPSRAVLSDEFVERRGRALGVFAAGFNVGGILASAVAALAVAAWRPPFLAVAVALLLAGLLYVRWNREPYVLDRRSRVELGATVRRLLANRRLRRPLVAFSLFYFVTRSVLGFFPAYLRAAKGFSPLTASVGFALIFAVGIPAKVGAGALSDRFPRRLVAAAGLALAMAALVGVLVVEATLPLLGLICAFALGQQALFPLVDAVLIDAAPEGNVGGDLGASRTVFFGVGSLGPAYVGVVTEGYGYAAAFGGVALALLGAAVLLAWGHAADAGGTGFAG